MCGQFTLSINELEVEQRFNRKNSEKFIPISKALPTHFLPIIGINNFSTIEKYRWGMPFDFNNSKKIIINTRAETILDKYFFKNLLLHKRCLVLANGFIEWDKTSPKQPYTFKLIDEKCFAFADIYSEYAFNNKIINCFSIITTQANDLVATMHNRMPVIIEKEYENDWIYSDTELSKLKNILKPFDENKMKKEVLDKSIFCNLNAQQIFFQK